MSFQSFIYYRDGEQAVEKLPEPGQQVIDGVQWGLVTDLFTPAFWKGLYLENKFDLLPQSPYKCHGTLAEEIVFCMLGGHGIKVELASAAFERCQDQHLIDEFEDNEEAWYDCLSAPIASEGRFIKYRFPRQKAKYLAGAMAFLEMNTLDDLSGVSLRNKLMEIKGVGPKTAGWITRNYCDSDEVAILDIHLIRAGVLCGLFSENHKLEKDYFDMELRYLEFCKQLNVRASVLDGLIWDEMRNLGDLVHSFLRGRSEESTLTSLDKANYSVQSSFSF